MNLIKRVKNKIKYITLPRIYNKLQIDLDTFFKRDYTKSYPKFLIVEPGNICNLKCPLCPTGQKLPIRRGFMTMETFTRIIDQLHRYVRHLNLFYCGEPLLCENLFQMIQYAKKHKLYVTVSSNLNIFNEKIADQLIDSELDHLIVSLDGTSQETYGNYRINGNINKVIENINLLIDKKKQIKKDHPRIFIQFVIFRHNEHEVPEIKKLAKRLGVEIFFRQGALGGRGQSPPSIKDRTLAKKWLTQNKKYWLEYDYFSDKPYLKDGACKYLWNVVTINWDGSVLPCCWVYDSKYRFGNIMEQDFKDIWNNIYFRNARRLFSRNGKTSFGENNIQETICYQCVMFDHSKK